MQFTKEHIKEDIGKLLIRERNRDVVYQNEALRVRKARWDDLFIEIGNIIDRHLESYSDEYSASSVSPSASSLSTA
jgi:hypothetical protein